MLDKPPFRGYFGNRNTEFSYTCGASGNRTMNLLLDADLDTKQALLDALGIATCLVEKQGDGYTVIAMNNLYLEYYGLAPDTQRFNIDSESMHKASGTPVEDLEPIALRMRTNVARCLATGESIHTENHMPQPDGSEKWSRNSIAPIVRGGEVAYVLVSVTDITEMIEAQTKIEENLTRVIGQHVRVCSGCARIHSETGEWMILESFMESRSDLRFTHGLCPTCRERLL